MKFLYQTENQTKQWLIAVYIVCVEHGFVNKTHTSFKKKVHRSVMLHVKHYSNKVAYLCLLFLVF